MSFQVGDRVLVDLHRDSIILGHAASNGRIYRVTGLTEDGFYTLSNGSDFYFSEGDLVPVELPIKVSVGWDLTKDLSITQAQYERICLRAEKTGRTTTEVLRMLLAAAMECFLEEGS